MSKKEVRFSISLGRDEHEMLHQLADEMGLSANDVFRQLFARYALTLLHDHRNRFLELRQALNNDDEA